MLCSMRVIEGSGKLLDATYFVEPAGTYKDLVMESRGGSRAAGLRATTVDLLRAVLDRG
jgi:hypothetical protein